MEITSAKAYHLPIQYYGITLALKINQNVLCLEKITGHTFTDTLPGE